MMKYKSLLLRCMHVAFGLFMGLYAMPSEAQNVIYRYTHIGNKHFRAERADKAEQYYLKVLKQNANNTRATFNLADVYLSKGNIKVADSLFNHVAQTDASRQVRAMAWHNRGYISQTAALKSRDQQQQLLQTAIEQYKQSLRYNPLDNRTRYNLALCQKQLKSMPPQPNQQQPKPNQQQQKKQQNKQQDKQQQQQKNNQQNQQNQQQKQQERQQTEQYINLAKQAEQRALQKLKQRQPAKRSLEKNW